MLKRISVRFFLYLYRNKLKDMISVEIRGVYDGVAFTYNKETKEFIWRDIVIERTTQKFRDEYEINFLENNIIK